MSTHLWFLIGMWKAFDDMNPSEIKVSEEEISEIDYNNYWVKPLPAENDAFSEEENEILDVDGD